MLEKLLLAAGLTLSLQIFPGLSTSAKLPKNLVLRSTDRPAQTVKLPLVAVPAGITPNVQS
ncbi:hypothetical protein Osc7112_4988 [Oscillatoria nigro-viridis PCC 7112]|uniref:Uncharacterized protein n=1 Tax=Phormidium nigroviride PCC 7112 TaxID=179408 RepID=K9VNX1_9CYAN|nr:hypothetical protein [Oscillatoria nigro-viridis]AFZ09254.1 hypothetical protein Osc7112_4988 [Oscillatoria nigro-viridis PCC 7112]